MNRFHKTSVSVTAVVTIAVCGLASMSAVSAQTTPRETFTENSEQRQQLRTERQQQRCERATARIANILARYSENHTAYETRYENIVNRVNTLITTLESKGYDVTELESELATLREMIANSKTLFQNAIAQLMATEDLACGESDGAFVEAVQAARESFKAFRSSAKDIRVFIKDTLRPTIQSLKDQDVANQN